MNNPQKDFSTSSAFFNSQSYSVPNEEELLDEYDDEKNDETFGDTGPLNDEWEQEHEEKAKHIELFKQQSKQKKPTMTGHMEASSEVKNGSSRNRDNSVGDFFLHPKTISFLEEDEEDEEDEETEGESILFKAPPPTPPRERNQTTGMEELLLNYGATQSGSTLGGSDSDNANKSRQLASTNKQNIGDITVEGEIDGESSRKSAKGKLFEENDLPVSVEDLEAQLMERLGVSGGVQDESKESEETSPNTGEQQQKQQSTPTKRSYSVYNTYLHPKAYRGDRSYAYGYFPIYKNSFQEYKYMSSDDLEMVTRQQMSDLQIKNPFLDDYYYCSFVNCRNASRRVPTNFVQYIFDAYSEATISTDSETTSQQTQDRPFGRIPAQTVKAPRTMFSFEKDEIIEEEIAKCEMNQNEVVQFRILIENGFDMLFQIEDLSLCKKYFQETFSSFEQFTKELEKLCVDILQLFDLSSKGVNMSPRILEICESRKGFKLLCKSLQLLPESYSAILLQACLTYWNSGLIKTLEKNNSGNAGILIKEMCFAVNHSSMSSLCAILSCILQIENKRQQQSEGQEQPLWNKDEGREFISTTLNKAHTLNKKEKNQNWRSLFCKLFAFVKGSLLRFADKNIRGGWEFLNSLLRNCSHEQKQTMLEELKSVIRVSTPSKEARMFTAISAKCK